MHFFIDVQDLTSAPQSGIEPSFHSVFRQRGPIDHRICQAHVIIAVTFATCRTVLVLPYFSSQQSRNIMLSGKFFFVIELPPQVIVTGIRITREQMSPAWNMISQRTVIVARCKFVEDGTHHISEFSSSYSLVSAWFRSYWNFSSKSKSLVMLKSVCKNSFRYWRSVFLMLCLDSSAALNPIS